MSKMTETQEESPTRRWLWIGLLGGATIGFSLVFACATPFVALVALAAVNMTGRDGLIVAGVVWLANQAVGYGLLGYPQTFDSYAWGAAIGIAVLLALLAGRTAAQRAEGGAVVPTGFAFGTAFAVYELVLFAASFALSSGPEAFSWSTVSYILQVNVLGLAALVMLQFLAATFGLARRPSRWTALSRPGG